MPKAADNDFRVLPLSHGTQSSMRGIMICASGFDAEMERPPPSVEPPKRPHPIDAFISQRDAAAASAPRMVFQWTV